MLRQLPRGLEQDTVWVPNAWKLTGSTGAGGTMPPAPVMSSGTPAADAPEASGRDLILSTMDGVRHVAVAGNMGVGKSTLTAALAERLGAEAFYETVEDHPYLERFYQDMHRWSFQSQFFFLSQAFSQHCSIIGSSGISVQDRTIYEHFHVFATSLHEQGLLDADDFRVLRDHYEALTAVVPGPDLMIYLRASVPTLQHRIQTRDRGCESTVSAEYLAELEYRYERWMSQYDASDVLIIETDSIDIHRDEHREQLLSLIEDRVRERSANLAVA